MNHPPPLQVLAASKIPQVTLLFWLVKICATPLGETAGDALSIFGAILFTSHHAGGHPGEASARVD